MSEGPLVWWGVATRAQTMTCCQQLLSTARSRRTLSWLGLESVVARKEPFGYGCGRHGRLCLVAESVRASPIRLRDLDLSCNISKMDAWKIAEDQKGRSDYVRGLLADVPLGQGANRHKGRSRGAAHTGSSVIVRFWHDPSGPPPDVAECLGSWDRVASTAGAELLLFDDDMARSFIAQHYGTMTSRTYDSCPHPAMRADLFRLCWLVASGGVYVDADDALVGDLPEDFLNSNQLQLQPLCYDRATGAMVPQHAFLQASAAESANWTFYANNAPIAAPAGHPVLITALERALGQVELSASSDGRWDIQATTGPGNLTAALVAHSVELANEGKRLAVRWLDWDSVAVSRYPLSYRGDARNWRRWNGTERVCTPPATTP